MQCGGRATPLSRLNDSRSLQTSLARHRHPETTTHEEYVHMKKHVGEDQNRVFLHGTHIHAVDSELCVASHVRSCQTQIPNPAHPISTRRQLHKKGKESLEGPEEYSSEWGNEAFTAAYIRAHDQSVNSPPIPSHHPPLLPCIPVSISQDNYTANCLIDEFMAAKYNEKHSSIFESYLLGTAEDRFWEHLKPPEWNWDLVFSNNTMYNNRKEDDSKDKPASNELSNEHEFQIQLEQSRQRVKLLLQHFNRPSTSN